MRQMSAEEFISALEKQQEISNVKIIQDVHLPTDIINLVIYRTRLIKDVFFSGVVKFNSLNNQIKRIVFESCVFENDVFFVDIDDSNDILKIILFKDCNFKKITIKNNTLVKTDIKFHGTDNLKNKIETFYISNNNTILSISIFGMTTKDIQLYDTIFNYFSISNIENEIVNIFNCIFSKDFWIQNIKSSIIFHLSNNNFEGDVIISDLISDTYRKENIFKRFLIQNTSFKSITFNGNITKIESLELYFSPKVSGTLYFENYVIDKIVLLQENTKASVTFNQGYFKEINFLNFSNYGNLTFSSYKAIENTKSIFSIENSNLGKTQFYDFDFASFSNININNAVLTEIVTANVTWFLPEKLNQTEEKEKDAKYYKNQREVYRQLKQSTDKQGDRIQSLDFQAEEMRVYKESLKIDKKASQNDRWILWISQSNNFGLSWWKPTWVLLLCTLFFYISMVFSGKLFYMPFNPNWSGFGNMLYEIFWKNGSVFFQLFNPTRDISKVLNMKSEDINGITHFLDISHRLIFGFFVFQIASGFRKYVK